MIKMLCWSFSQPNYTAIAETCNTFRVYGDIYNSYASVGTVLNYYGDDVGNFSQVTGPGSFADGDMVGLLGLNV